MVTNSSPSSVYKTPLFHKKALTDRILLIDGLTRAGKMLTAPLVSNLTNIDYAQFQAMLDQLPILWRLGLIDDNTASAFLRLQGDIVFYDRAVGRHMNTRLNDVYSIYRSLSVDEMLRRTVSGEGSGVIDRFNRESRIQSYITHEILPNAHPLLTAYPGLRVLRTDRHPVDICYSWHTRNWGERWGNDPYAFSVAADTPDGPVPWFAVDFADTYYRLTPTERIIRCVLHISELYEKAEAEYAEKAPDLLHTVAFENIVTRPLDELQKIASWLKTDVPDNITIAMARERVPRTLDDQSRKDKLHVLHMNLSDELIEQLNAASRKYEEKWDIKELDHFENTNR